MRCASCDAVIDPGDRFCPACRMPNMAGTHHPRFGPPEREPRPLFVDRVAPPGLRPCPRCSDGIRASDHYCRSCGIEVSSLAPLPPPGRTVGVWTTPGPEGDDWYRSTAVLTGALRLLLVFVAALSVALVANSLLIDHDLGGWVPFLGQRGPHPNWADLQTWGGNLAALQLCGIGLASVLILLWTRRSYRNLPALNVMGQRLGRRWAVWGWLVPGVNLVVPRRIVDDTWRASDPTDPPYAEAWSRRAAPTTHLLWWICTLVALPMVVLIEAQLSLAGTLPPTTSAGVHNAQIGYLLLIGSQVLLAFAALLLARIVGSVHERQRDRAVALGPVAPTARPWRPAPASATPESESQPEAPAQPALVHAIDARTSGATGRY